MKVREKILKIRPLFWALSALAAVLLTVAVIGTRTGENGNGTAHTGSASLAPNPLTPENFAYEGDYLTCLSAEAVLGIDVSVWQGQIDWEQVKAAGVRFAMIRLGYRSMNEGTIHEDSMARANYTGARAAGITVGAYFFSQAVSPEEAEQEAEFVLELVEEWELEMPIVYDWEHTGQDTRTADVDARTLTDCVNTFCRTVEAQGHKAMVYFNAHQAEHSMYLEELAGYPFWFAQYDQMLECPYRVDMWQYTNKGRVPGISTDVDMNLFFIYS